VDEKFKNATDLLSSYEWEYHHRETVTKVMEAAKAKDTSLSSIMNKLKVSLLVRKALASFLRDLLIPILSQ